MYVFGAMLTVSSINVRVMLKVSHFSSCTNILILIFTTLLKQINYILTFF